jgi:dipeptidyl-peptidase 4
MKTNPTAFPSLCLLLAATALAQDPTPTTKPAAKPLTYEDATRPIAWNGPAPQARLAWDGAHVEWKQDGKTVWFDPRTKDFVEPKPEPEKSDAKPQPATFVARIDKGDLVVERRSAAPAEGGGRRGRRNGGAAANGSDPFRLTTDGDAGGKKSEPHCNAAGTRASFVKNGNLFVVDVASKDAWQVTQDGSDEMLHGILDWVYQEEIYGRGDFQGHWWSSKGDHVALLSLDESKVREFTIVDHVPTGFLDKERSVVTEVTNYPKVGDPNPRAMLSVVDCAKKSRTQVDLSAYPEDVLVARVAWTVDDRLLVVLQDRIQTWADLCSVDTNSGKLTKWIREESTSWVNRPGAPRFLADGTFLWLSERTGYQHVYHYEAGGKLIGAVTHGEWQVREILRVDEKDKLVWFEGTKDGATGRHMYRCAFDGRDLVCLTPGVGTHQAELSADASFAIDRWSAMDMPTVVRVVDAKGSELVRVGEAAMGEAATERGFVGKNRLSIPARDGYVLDASLMLPPSRKPGEKAPIYLPTYSGPDAPSVRDMWMPSGYQIFAAQQGFLVLQVNVRTASGRGHAHISKCYKQLGVQELKDLEDAVAFVCKEHGGDAARVAIEGWSYGGFMAAYALTHSDTFQLGLAGAGVYDWRLYDTIYTERYMALPDGNKQGYEATSVIKAAKDLRGHLVLQHGSMDDNVHLQNTMQLLWELQKAGKQNFELMVYPRSQHGPNPQVAGHVKAYQWRALKKLLDPAWKPE